MFKLCRRFSSTFQNQSVVPRLPIPTLEQTTAKYLQSLKPILTAEEFSKSEQAVAKFLDNQSGIGHVLQQRLIEYDKTQKNSWLEKFWYEKAYLEWREPTMINVNWWVEFVDSPAVREHRALLKLSPSNVSSAKGQLSSVQINRAAGFITGLLDFKDLLETEQLPPEYMGKKRIPLCMNQYRMQFGVTRVPDKPGDRILHQFPATGRHIIVMIEDQIYSVPVLNEDGRRAPIEEIEAQLWKVWEMHKQQMESSRQPAVGLLTTEQRDKWTDSYKLLRKLSPRNAESLDCIEQSLFAVCLETFAAADDIDVSHRVYFHGQGGANRWFDKSWSFIFMNDGRGGCSGEHSPSDAVIPGRIIGDVLSREPIKSQVTSSVGLTEPEALKWQVNENIEKAIEEAGKRAAADIEDVDSVLLHFNDYGADKIKTDGKASPDAFVQMALQLAYYRIYKQSCPTYESASTRQYLHGRTETIRSCTTQSCAFVSAFDDAGKKNSEKIQLFVDALKAHTQYTIDATNALGCDRHLMGLRLMLSQGETADLFTDPAYLKSMNFKLSTSNVSPGDFYYGGFGPVAMDGYGVNYAIGQKKLKFSISSRRQAKDTCSRSFRKMLGDSLRDLMSLASSGGV